MKFYTFLFILSILYANPNIHIIKDYDQGLALAKESDKPIFLLFTGEHCKNNLDIHELINSNKIIAKELKETYIPIFLHVDDQTPLAKEIKVLRNGKQKILKSKGSLWANIELTKFGSNMQPLMVIIDKYEKVLKEPFKGNIEKDELIEYLKL